jgi:glycosyltransferase involved in cell wall biosynthesis
MESKAKKEISYKNHAYIFNLSTDLDDPSLAFTTDWIKAFSSEFKEVHVYSTKLGRTEFITNVKYIETGGGTAFQRIRAVYRLQKALIKIVINRNSSIAFHHMSTKTCLIVGPALRLFGVPQGLWYSHSKKNLKLKFASWIANRVFSSTESALPIKSPKAYFVGHGLNVSKFKVGLPEIRNNRILSLGRIARVKNNEALIAAIARANCGITDVYLAGPLSGETNYLEELKNYGVSLGVNVHHIPPVTYDEVAALLVQYSVCYTGSPNSVDKSVIEGAMTGCFTIALQEFVLEQTGMAQILKSLGIQEMLGLDEQIRITSKLFNDNARRIELSNLAKEINNVENTVKKIVSELQKE